MPRLVSPLGVVVSVSEEKAARLGSGWRPFEVEPEKVEPPKRKRQRKSEQ